MAVRHARAATSSAALVAAILASSMSYIDSTALTVALPVIKVGLRTSDAQAQWIIEGYLLFLSSLILIGGALGDRYGRRRVLAVGTSAFTFASVACAVAASPEFLIAARCLQGIGAALMIPQSLALITETYDATRRGRAIGTWAAASAITMAAGPLLGGWLTQAFSWRWVFWINVPLATILLLLILLRVSENRAETIRSQPDWLGSACITLALAALVAGLTQMQSRLLDPSSALLLLIGILLAGAFAFVERRAAAPILPPHLLRSRTFGIANAYTFLFYAALGGALFYVPFQLQHVLQYGALPAGLALLPTIGLVAITSPAFGALAARRGPRRFLMAGALISALGYALFMRVGADAPYVSCVLPATVVLGVGLSTAIAPLVATAMGAAGTGELGSASGINNAISRVGNLVAIAILGIVIAASGNGPLPTAARPQGFADAMLAAAAMSAMAALVAALLPRSKAELTLPGVWHSGAAR